MPSLFGGFGDTPGKEFFLVPDQVKVDPARVFEIGDRLAAGGNGVVHRCTDNQGYECAIKFQLDQRPDRVERFAREIRLLSEVQHDHLMTYVGHGSVLAKRTRKFQGSIEKNRPTTLNFVVMSLAQRNLSQLIKSEATLPAIYYPQFRGLARALGRLHHKAIHRDIKPDNILVIGDRWVLSDYGLCNIVDTHVESTLTPDWQVVGPRFWMSPEANNQSIGRSDSINAASDVFQLASVFWYVVNGTHPTGVLTRADWTGPDSLFEPIYKGLHYSTDVRPRNGDDFADQLDAAIMA
jgi:serine/threonine protein kinase